MSTVASLYVYAGRADPTFKRIAHYSEDEEHVLGTAYHETDATSHHYASSAASHGLSL